MTALRQRMIECLQLRGLSERTQESYVRAVRQLAEHYHKSPDLITEEELRQYFLYLKNLKHYSRSTATIAICGIKFFFERTLERDWRTFSLVRPAPEKKLPVILSLAEVRQILSHIRLPRYRSRESRGSIGLTSSEFKSITTFIGLNFLYFNGLSPASDKTLGQ